MKDHLNNNFIKDILPKDPFRATIDTLNIGDNAFRTENRTFIKLNPFSVSKPLNALEVRDIMYKPVTLEVKTVFIPVWRYNP